ncbi:ArdC family protein [Methylobacterium sp.]|uniref:ArdC family protein n=1 Tax=Methylobacterium sp. TaxID=409 RepID=UPI0025E4BD92|nr:ArdC family protein [Methylobacterium sp.]
MADPHTRVTATILQHLATADPAAWVCPWHCVQGGLPHNALTGRSYRGINTFALWCSAQGNSYAEARWATCRQWAKLGAQVRLGEKGSPVLF